MTEGRTPSSAGFDAAYTRALDVGVIGKFTLDAPVLSGNGDYLFDGGPSFGFEPVEVLHSLLATHVRYRKRSAD